ncbi:MAG: hypothetical protein ACQERD_10110 [Campylobacterota bacterium]
MKNRNYWPLFFIGIFSLAFSLIIWTITSTLGASLDEDESFNKKYQDVDEYYNEIMHFNALFSKKYKLLFVLNEKEFNLGVEDIKYSQRVLKDKSKHKDTLNLGENSLLVYVLNKSTNKKVMIDEINLKFTLSNTNKQDILLKKNDFIQENNKYKTNVDITKESNWNITGSFQVGKDKGYIYIKTNAK